MALPSDRTMPVIDAYPVPPLRGDHYRAAFPDGERTYPSRETMTRAASRIGAAVRFHPEPAQRTTTREVGASPASSSPALGRGTCRVRHGGTAGMGHLPRPEAGPATET